MNELGPKHDTALFEVFLRLRPSETLVDRFLEVEEVENAHPSHVIIRPPANDSRRRFIDKYEFARVFTENTSQLEVFQATGLLSVIEGVIDTKNNHGKDGMLATLGVTGSGKSHTILGTKTQRGLTQMSLDVLFRAIAPQLVDATDNEDILQTLSFSDICDSKIMPASTFLELGYGEGSLSGRLSKVNSKMVPSTRDSSFLCIPGASSKRHLLRASTLPHLPNSSDISLACDPDTEYAVILSMYEIYNDRIFDLLASKIQTVSSNMQQRRTGLLIKTTAQSADQRVVIGLRKVICSSLDEALLVLEAGISERQVGETGSNLTSSRSHAFLCVEVRQRRAGTNERWQGGTMTIADLAGSERARQANTTGSAIVETGKINGSLMFLGQCLELKSFDGITTNGLFRQCKLTDILFSNYYASNKRGSTRRPLSKAIMIVTADPSGNFSATNQILHYSAVAREVTVPRQPSVSYSAFSCSTNGFKSGITGREIPVHGEIDNLLEEMAKLRNELEITQVHLANETSRRMAAEESWRATLQRCDEIEMQVREEVCAEYETRMAQQSRRWRTAEEDANERYQERLDAKVDIISNGIKIHQDNDIKNDTKYNELEESHIQLEKENQSLKDKLESMDRDRKPLPSPTKKVRTLGTRKWQGSGIGFETSP